MPITIERARIDAVLQVIVSAVHGDYATRVALAEHEDDFLEVEVGVNYLLDELIERHRQNHEQRVALADKAQELAAQKDELLAALSTPILEVWPGVLALPIVGRVDAARAALITARLLERVAAARIGDVILDLTGVATVADETMPALVRMVRAMALLGASCTLTGVQPDIARQVISAGIDASGVRVAAQVSDALAGVLAERGALRR